MAEPLGGLGRRRLLGLAGLGAVAAGSAVTGCAPALVTVQGTGGGPFGTTASPSAPPSSARPSVTPSRPAPTSAGPTPSPTPTLPPLSGDTIVLNGSSLSFLAPRSPFAAGWAKTLGSAENGINRTFYDNAVTQQHITVEVDPPSGQTPLAHARALAAEFQQGHSSYHQFALGGGIDGGATWAWSYVSNGVTLYAIDWFRAFGPFDAAIEVYGPIADKLFIKALWRSIVDSAFTQAPYQQQTSGNGLPLLRPTSVPSAAGSPAVR